MRKAAVYLGSRAVDKEKVAAYLHEQGNDEQVVFAAWEDFAAALPGEFTTAVVYDEPDKLPAVEKIFALTLEMDQAFVLTPEDVETEDGVLP